MNKLYLLRSYHKKGLGRRLIRQVAERFIGESVFSMILFSELENPTGRYFESLGAEKIYAANGVFHGAYGWRNLKELIKICDL